MQPISKRLKALAGACHQDADHGVSRRSFLRWMTSSLVMGASLSGCHELHLTRFFNKEEAMQQNVREALRGEEGHSRLVGDYIKIADSTLAYIKVQGVGLVTQLDGTGDDPPITTLRTRLLNDLRKEKIEDPNTVLRSADTTLVVVTAYIPPIAKKGDRIDVEVVVPEGSEAVSLKGGLLHPCHLSEHALMAGQVHSGADTVMAAGPILIDGLFDTASGSGTLRRGRIPGGAVYTGEDRILTVAIRSDYRRVRMSTHLADRIGQRFHDYDQYGIRQPLTKPKTNSHLEMIVQEKYRNNYPRFLQCVRHITLSEAPVEKHLRLQSLSEQVMFGPTSEKAALQLEAEGPEGIAPLKRGLTSESPEARFRSAEALAYLDRPEAVPELKKAAHDEPAFRIFALAALACLDSGESISALLELMAAESLETRYGAFRALTTLAPDDPIAQGTTMEGNFKLHLIDSTARPFVHVTRNKKAEIVLFGRDQEFHLPLMVRAGSDILIRGDMTGKRVEVTRVATGEEKQSRVVSAKVADVIRAAVELGATYPDVVQMLVEADNQSNLPGDIAFDAIPRPGRVYHRVPEDFANQSEYASSSSSTSIGSDGLIPNLFDEQSNKTIAPSKPEETEQPAEAGTTAAEDNSLLLD